MKSKYYNYKEARYYFNSNLFLAIISIYFCCMLGGCKKFITVDAPITSTNDGNVYKTDATAIAVLTGIYINMSNDNSNYLAGISSMTLFPALSADELTIYGTDVTDEILDYYTNQIKSNVIGTDFYSKSYKNIFTCNAAIAGLSNTQVLTPVVKNQLLGEAYFIRAFSYFNLVNIFGGVPLITSQDYTVTSLQSKSSTDEIYEFIKKDLITAQSLLSEDYLNSTLLKPTSERIRPNRFSATALLARTYLYTKDYNNANIEATTVIDKQSTYDIVPLNSVFLANSDETIWSIQPVGIETNSNTGEGKLFVLPESGPSLPYVYYLNDHLLNAFEAGDQRYFSWIDSVEVEGTIYHYPYKYKVPELPAATTEYSIVLRLAEQYLIRAEAKIQLGDIAGGIADLNTLRLRATDQNALPADQLKQLSITLSKEDAIKAVIHERQVELFTEWGHRWLDLKRTNTIDDVMKVVTPLKGGTWDTRWALYPFPLHEIQNNPNLVQNPGYE